MFDQVFWNSLIILLSVPLSFIITKAYISFANNKNIQDIPSDRSLHTKPTPRGGGVAIFLTFSLFCVVLSLKNLNIWPLVFASGLVAGIGFLDDIKGLSARLRLGVHFLSAIIFLVFLTQQRSLLSLGFTEIPINFVVFVFLLLFIVWMINLYNFMDGVDGIASVQAITVALSFSFLNFIKVQNTLSALSLILAGSVLGFYFLNKSPAKVFMGDIASGFLGFIFAALMIKQATEGGVHYLSALILMATFIFDSTATLLVRFFNKKKLYAAHRDHIYQHMVSSGMTHSRVTLLYGVINLAWLFPLAYLSEVKPHLSILLLFCAYLPFLGLALKYQPGIEMGVVNEK